MTRNSSKKRTMTKMELDKLKFLLPTLKQKSKSSPMEIVLETIRYIRELEDQLLDRFQMDISVQSNTSTDSSLSSTSLHDIENSN